MREYVLNLIKNKERRYIEDYSEMIGDYKRELETIKGYNGRQLLELLQNCDDEGATRVTITLNEVDDTISIHNNGKTSFSKKGYRSLFIANLSSKTSRKYIGNKGLGFRSIINWSKSIEIQSNNLSLFYSAKNTKENYELLFDKEERRHIVKEENLSENTIPMPFLTMPVLKDIEQGKFKTAIIIEYRKKAFKDILKQVESITPETLLFLKHIEEIEFIGFDNVNQIVCKRTGYKKRSSDFAPKEYIKFVDHSWLIFEEENKLPHEFQDTNQNEKEYYQIKIAVEENFEKSSPYLYSFFPTKIKLNQPYVLHATFDLDSTRNQLNDSNKNHFILEKVVEFTIKVAKYFAESKVSYQPLSILTHNHRADTLDSLGYYNLIEDAIRTESIFPCVDNTYKILKEIIYVNDEFAQILLDLKATENINIHLLPLIDKSLTDFNLENEVDRDLELLTDLIEILNEIFSKKMSIGQRAQFIRILTEEASLIKQKHKNKFDFLVDKFNQKINGNEYIYTPITRGNELKTPSFTDIKFVNSELFDALLEEFRFNESLNSNKSRFIYDALKGFCNIHSYEPATLAQKIIRETNNAIEINKSKSIEFIQEMNTCLYHNFKIMKEDTKIPDETLKIPTITKNNRVAFTEDLVLSEYYPIGKRVAYIFKNVYTDNNFIAKPSILGLDDIEDNYEIERYLKWLKVNTFAKYQKQTFTNYGLEDYVDYVEQNGFFHRRTGYKVEYSFIVGFEKILKKISVEKLILWIYYDEVFSKQLYDYNNDDEFKYFYRTSVRLPNKPSYIKYLILKVYKVKFTDFLIDEKYSWINDIEINYKKISNYDSNINKTIINEILVSLGAKDNFNDLPIERVAAIINKLPEHYPTGAKSQNFYRRALSHYRENEQEINEPLFLFAHNGIELGLFDQSQIYFSEKIKLPNKLKEYFPIFNYPPRAGGTDAIKFFGINDLKDVQISVINENVLPQISQQLSDVIEALKPFLLAHRLNIIEDRDSRKLQAGICKKIEIILCDHIEYSFNDKNFEVSVYEFLHSKEQTYYIKVNEYDTIDSIRKNAEFANAFADIISLAFDVISDKNEFKYIFRGDFEDVQKSILTDLGIDILNDSRELLGFADYKQAFWKAVFQGKGETYPETLDDLSLEERLVEIFNLSFDTDSLEYGKITEKSELMKIESLFSDLELRLVDFAKYYPYEISLGSIHLSTIKDAILSKKPLIKSSIWSSLIDKDIEEKASFLEVINRYEDFLNYSAQKAESSKYVFKLNHTDIFEEFKTFTYPNLKLIEGVNIELVKQRNKNNFNDDELYEISQNERLKSLLYFEDALDIIRDEIRNNLIIDESHLNDKDDTTILSKALDSKILSSELLIPTVLPNGPRAKNVFTPRDKNSKGLKQMGNSAEKVVYDHLIQLGYKGVDLVSEDNEGLQCDIRYSNAENVVKFVEVKNFDNGSFYLSKAQYDFGKENKEDYELWLVKNKVYIFPIYDFFTNPKYETSLGVNEFKVHLNIGILKAENNA